MRYAKPFILFVLCTLFSVQSFAQAKPSKEKIKQALVLIQDANDDLENKDYKYALEGYKEAYNLYPTAVLLYRMALTNDKLGNKAEAILFYKQYIDSKKPNDKLKALSEARLAELDVSKTVSVSITSDPSGASIFTELDGESLGETPKKIELPAGKQTVYLKLKGYDPYTLKTTLEQGKDAKHDISLVKAKGELVDTKVVEEEDLDEPSNTGIMTTLGWTSIGLGVASLVAGGTFSLLSSSKENEANNYNKRGEGATPTELNELRDSAISFSEISTIFYISGGVLAAGGIALVVLDKGSERETTINVLPLKGGAAVGFSSNF